MDNYRRPGWNEYFMVIAKLVSSRSSCLSRPVGAVVVKDNHILATGYNGSIPGQPHCTDDGVCFRRRISAPEIDKYNYCRATHAEANTLAQAAKYGISVQNGVLYSTLSPCYVCLKLLAGARIKEIYYEHQYESEFPERDQFWLEAIKSAGMKFHQLSVSPETLEAVNNRLKGHTSSRRLKSGGYSSTISSSSSMFSIEGS